MPALGGRDHLRLVLHQRQPRRHPPHGRLGQRHAGHGTRGGLLEGAQQRADELPVGQPAGDGATHRDGVEVGAHERVGELALKHLHGQHLALVLGVVGDRGGDRLLGRLLAGGGQQVALPRAGLGGDLGVLGQQRHQPDVAGGGGGHDLGQALEPLELLGAARLGEVVGDLDPVALLAQQHAGGLEARPVSGRDGAALHAALDLAQHAREHRDHALVVGVTLGAATAVVVAAAGRPAAALGGRAVACGRVALTRSGHVHTP